MQFSEVAVAENMLVHFSTELYCICSRDHFIYRYSYDKQELALICRLPASDDSLKGLIKDWIARTSLMQKIRKSPGIWHVLMANDEVVVIYDKVYRHSANHNSKFMKVMPCIGDSGSFLPPLRGGCAVHLQSQNVYFGEYVIDRSQAVKILRIDLQANLVSTAYTFQPGQIRHIHAIRYDKFRNRLWITTGDSNSESAFYYTDDEFATVHRFAGGDQSWRAISLIFDAHGMEWGMDAGKDAEATDINKIYRYDFQTDCRSELAVIGNPAYYSAESSDGCAWLATTFEPGRLQDTAEQAALWYRDQHGNWEQVMAFDYSAKPRKGVSKYAQLLLPYGICPAETLMFTPINTSEHHFSAYKMQTKF
jgi:hypothetical protein